MNMNQARNGHRSKKTGSTRNISTDIHAGHPMAGVGVPTLDTEIASRVKPYLVLKLETYGITTFEQLLQCTHQFLRLTVRISKDKVDELRSFIGLIKEGPVVLFPEETAENMSNIIFLERYPFNTEYFNPIYSIVDEVKNQTHQTMD